MHRMLCAFPLRSFASMYTIRLSSIRAVFWGLSVWAMWAMWAMWATPAQARDIRLALLVGNQDGWANDPKLRYVLSGDIHPLARQLRRLGFVVKTLEDGTPQDLRKAWAWVHQRIHRAPRVQTFLFYYTGHADRQFLHQAKLQRGAVSYKELVSFVQNLPIKRRFVILDACYSGEVIRQFGSLRRFRDLVPKGARAQHRIDLSQHIPQNEDERSLQILSSGLALSWESKRYRASIFTHHLLRGLQGHADRDKDGKISLHELFDFISDAMYRDIQEKPQLFGVIRRSHAYSLAPAYNSTLWIGASVLGDLQVSVDNFFWAWRKREEHAIRLSLVHGRGVVLWRHKGVCRLQSLVIPKGQEARLSTRWQTVGCSDLRGQRKGTVELSSEVERPAASETLSLELHLSMLGTQIVRDALLGGGTVGLRHRYFAIHLGLFGSSNGWQKAAPSQHFLLDLRLDVGYRFEWHLLDLFLGGYVGGSILLQDTASTLGAGPILQYGIALQPTLWLSDRFGLSLHVRIGMSLAQLGERWLHSFVWASSFGFHLRL